MTKIDIVSGFLGAGKTTLIKKLINEALDKEKLVLIENEYGEVGIDGGFLKDSGIEITEMNSGCICCTLVGDFVSSIDEIMNRFAPDRIIIEPSGVGKLSDVMAAVIGMEETHDLKLDALVTVVNVLTFKKQKSSFGEFFSNQIEHATTVILSRTAQADDEKTQSCMKMIQELNKDAAIITTDWNEISGEKILSVIEGRDNLEMKTLAMHNHEHDSAEHEHHHHDHSAEGPSHAHCHEHETKHEHHHHHDHGEHHDEHHHHHHGHSSEGPSHAHCHEHETKHEHHHHHHGHSSEGPSHAHCHEHETGHHHADEIFDTWGKETAKKFTKEDIEAVLKKFANSDEYGDILRSKGMVSGENEWIYFDYVEGEYELRSGQPDYTGRLVVIGTDLKTSKIEEIFGL